VEVKIGVQWSARELVLDCTQTPEEVEQAVLEAIKGDGLLSLVDEKGRRVLVPSAKLAYIEIAKSEPRRVGFASG